jgi:hypothetical protein
MMKKIMKMEVRMRHSYQGTNKPQVDFEKLWDMVNTWRDRGSPEVN